MTQNSKLIVRLIKLSKIKLIIIIYRFLDRNLTRLIRHLELKAVMLSQNWYKLWHHSTLRTIYREITYSRKYSHSHKQNLLTIDTIRWMIVCWILITIASESEEQIEKGITKFKTHTKNQVVNVVTFFPKATDSPIYNCYESDQTWWHDLF